jgi:hypothetical protein
VGDEEGVATLSFTTPPVLQAGVDIQLQALVIRGLNGFASVATNPLSISLEDDFFGCTDPNASNYDPMATADDGTCMTGGYMGPAGPDLSGDGWTLCSGTDDSATTFDAFYTPCDTYTEVRFACSVGADSSAEFVSDPIAVAGSDFLDGTCDDWAGGSNSNFQAGKILSIDSTDPGCGNYNVNYDLYMDMVSPQWGCAGSINTHTSGGRMWMFGRNAAATVDGCTDPTATNYDPNATNDDGSCITSSLDSVGPQFAGWTQCGGTADPATDVSALMAGCNGYGELQFACSADSDGTAEYVSPAIATNGADLTDDTCDDLPGASLTPYQNDYILSVDSTDPGCGNYNVSYDMYMDSENTQWGCAQSINTDGSGRMWVYGR